MAIPASYNTGIVKGKYTNLDGSAASGKVTFTPRALRIVAIQNETVVIPRPLSVALDITGSFSITLPATDDPDISPLNFTYSVVEDINGGGGAKYDLYVPVGSTTDVSSVVEGATSSGGTTIIQGPQGPPGTGGDQIPTDPAAGVGGLRTLGTGQFQAAAGNDPRFIPAPASDPSPSIAGLRTLGQGAQQAAAGNDPRFTSTAPTDPAPGVAGLRTLGQGAQQAAAGNDPRFTTGGTGYTVSLKDASLQGGQSAPQGNGSTDDTAAIQRVFTALRYASGVSGARLTIPPGEYIISDTIAVTRFAGIVQGNGVGFGSPTQGKGTTFRWNGPAGRPMFKIRDSTDITFEHIRFEGRDGFRPTAALNFNWLAADTIGANYKMRVLDCWFGTNPWSTLGANKGQLQNGILVDGDNGNNCQFSFERCTFQDVGAGIDSIGVKMPNTQSVGGSLIDCFFYGMHIGMQTSSSTTMFNAQFWGNDIDLDIQSTARVYVFSGYSENVGTSVATIAPDAGLIWHGGYMQVRDQLASGTLIAAYPSGAQTIWLKNVIQTWDGGANAEDTAAHRPKIRFGGRQAAPSYIGNFDINIEGSGWYTDQLSLDGAIWAQNPPSRGTVEMRTRNQTGHYAMRNEMGPTTLGDKVRQTLDYTAWDFNIQADLAYGQTGTVSNLPTASTKRDGFLYAATDQGGIPYIKSGAKGSGSWLQPKFGAEMVALVKPNTNGSSVTLTAASTWYAIPEIITGNVTYDGRPIIATLSGVASIQTTGTYVSGSTEFALQYNINGGTTWYNFISALESNTVNLFGTGLVRSHTLIGALPAAEALSSGNIIKVRGAIMRGDATSRTSILAYDTALGAVPVLQIVRY